jgi:hypothetical protein
MSRIGKGIETDKGWGNWRWEESLPVNGYGFSFEDD